MKFSYVAAAMLAFALPASAHAGTFIFNGVCGTAGGPTCSPSTNGTYGNAVILSSTTNSALQMKVSAWQMTQPASGPSTVSKAFLGSYSGGFGVTGVQDNLGNGNLHQIDNVNGYTDFVLLQFNKSVHLEGINVNIYGINNVYDSDASFSNGAGIAPVVWDATMNLSSYLGGWSTTAGDATQGAFLTDNATGFSKVWLVSASMLTPDRDDGFKLSSIKVSIPAVPEPATWAMLMVGFGAIGATLRRRRSEAATAFA